MNLLLVPFPYHMDGGCFVAGNAVNDDGRRRGTVHSALFTVHQRWLERSKRSLVPFVRELVERASLDVGRVDGVVFPELALDKNVARTLMAELQRLGIEIFVGGVMGKQRNSAVASFDFGNARWTQDKHHRWRLDGRQIRRYQLGHVFDPAIRWWEDIRLGVSPSRSKHGGHAVHFVEARSGAVVCVLICEDLARHDPVHPAVRAVGPSLVIALLMDGPQFARRWPGQYASVLADDPGSAVLTLTSLGMLRRSAMPGEHAPRVVALWKDASGEAHELLLPSGSHALTLSVNARNVEELTLDGRSDQCNTVELTLGAVHAVTHPRPPAWAVV